MDLVYDVHFEFSNLRSKANLLYQLPNILNAVVGSRVQLKDV